ncbi:hypothetical protein J7E71_02795 [Mesobacillus foraminis]|uniref:hypothetical protein n=1 Tax=Mesobacillus foraminis TaxID=279826 RepID=UPI001BE61E62|nr:hypothetical protein [Mesobacillus foraminis]MBT2754877.1 hypothetical protein [Mesobacillus foraminis]
MLAKLLKLPLGFICGYLIIIWIPVETPFHPAEFFAELLFHPIEFLAAANALIIGFMAYGSFFRTLISGFISILKREAFINASDLLFYSIFLAAFFILFRMSFWHTAVLFCFSFVYGMISNSFTYGAEKKRMKA